MRALLRALPAVVVLAAQALLVIRMAVAEVPLDYRVEADGAFASLAAGDVSQFLASCPAYCGSLILRSPLVVPGEWVFADLTARYVLAALACALPAAWLALLLVRRVQDATGRASAGWCAALLVALSPVTINAFRAGHPEDVLVGVAVVAAVLAAADRRPVLTGLLLGFAIVAKPWAVVAIGPVLLSTPDRRVTVLFWALAAGATLALPSYLQGEGGFAQAKAVAQYAGPQVRPPQAWWFLGDSDPVMVSRFGEVLDGYRTPPSWVLRATHPVVVLAAFALAGAVWLRHRRLDVRQGLLLLAAVLLIRGMFDTWNFPYYEAPFLFAVVAWEIHAHAGQVRRSLAVSILLWFTLIWSVSRISADAQALVFLGWSVPVLALMARALLARPQAAQPAARATTAGAPLVAVPSRP